ncbi:MAG TPA: hypothetical protein VLB90_04185 [Pseudomonadales bacterium]|nr:hypothetical protein [Pseudomonadales bacterium]
MKSISCAVRYLILASSLVAVSAIAAEDPAKAPATSTAVAGKPAAGAAAPTSESDKKKEAQKSPYLLQQPKQQQHNKHKNEKLFDKKEAPKKAADVKK